MMDGWSASGQWWMVNGEISPDSIAGSPVTQPAFYYLQIDAAFRSFTRLRKAFFMIYKTTGIRFFDIFITTIYYQLAKFAIYEHHAIDKTKQPWIVDTCRFFVSEKYGWAWSQGCTNPHGKNLFQFVCGLQYGRSLDWRYFPHFSRQVWRRSFVG